MEIDIIGFFKRFVYKITYIYNLIDYFSKYIYLHLTFRADINNVIISFDYYLKANPKFYIVYIDAGLYFISQKLYIYF